MNAIWGHLSTPTGWGSSPGVCPPGHLSSCCKDCWLLLPRVSWAHRHLQSHGHQACHHLPRSPEAVPLPTRHFQAGSPGGHSWASFPGALSLPSSSSSSHRPSPPLNCSHTRDREAAISPGLYFPPPLLPAGGQVWPQPMSREKARDAGASRRDTPLGTPSSCTFPPAGVPFPRSVQTERGRDRRQPVPGHRGMYGVLPLH